MDKRVRVWFNNNAKTKMASPPVTFWSLAAAYLATCASHVQAVSRFPAQEERNLLNKREGIVAHGFEPMDGVNKHNIHLTVNHLAKAGGTFVHDMVSAALPADRLNWEREGDGINVKDSSENFVIGMVRSPYNYYVSLWSYTSDRRHCCFRNSLAPVMQDHLLGKDKVLGSTEEDKARFRQWLREVSTGDLGLMSLRFYGSYLNFRPNSTLGRHNGGQRPDHMRMAGEWEKGSVQWVLESRARQMLGFPSHVLPGLDDSPMFQRLDSLQFDRKMLVRRMSQNISRSMSEDLNTLLASMQSAKSFGDRPVNCWMHTENIVPDLQACLQRYEGVVKMFENSESPVNWERFQREVQSANHNEALPHVQCNDFYDEASREFVRTADAHLFEAFGYSTEYCA